MKRERERERGQKWKKDIYALRIRPENKQKDLILKGNSLRVYVCKKVKEKEREREKSSGPKGVAQKVLGSWGSSLSLVTEIMYSGIRNTHINVLMYMLEVRKKAGEQW